MKKRVLFVTTHPASGGAQKWTYDQLYLLRDQFEVFLATGSEGWLVEVSTPLCKDVYVDKGLYAFTSIRYLMRLRKYVRENHIDLIVASSANAGIYARLLKLLLTSIAVVYVSHGWSAIYRGNLFHRMIERGLSYLTDSILVISQSDYRNAVDILKISSRRLKLIENGIFPYEEEKCISPTPSTSTTFQIVMIARFEPPKRHDLLIEAARKLTHMHFYFVGDGEGRAVLEANAPANITFRGTLREVQSVLLDADIFVLLSDSEGMPLAVLEALACSKPLLLSDLPSMRLFIHENGLLTKNNVEAIVEALNQMQNGDLETWGRISRKIFEDSYNLEMKKEEYLLFYKEMINLYGR